MNKMANQPNYCICDEEVIEETLVRINLRATIGEFTLILLIKGDEGLIAYIKGMTTL